MATPETTSAEIGSAKSRFVDPANFSLAMWERLEKMGATPVEVAAHCPEISEFEAFVALQAARERIAQAAREVWEILRFAEPVRETEDQKIIADALRSGLVCPSGS